MNEKIYGSLKSYLLMDSDKFEKEIRSKAYNSLVDSGVVNVSGLLALSNVCKNDCSYCGLGRSNKIKRFTLSDEDIYNSIHMAKDNNLSEIFFIGGENPAIKIESYVKYIKEAKKLGLKTNLAMGVFSLDEYIELKDAGLDTYTLKFESSNKSVFESSKPDISFEDRIESIKNVKKAGLKLASSSIVGLKGQSIDDIVNDIKLTIDLDVEWAPIVPYLPSLGTRMAVDTPPGDISFTLRSISLLRLLKPKMKITAAQPRKNSTLGFKDPQGNLDAIRSGANMLFVELTPYALRKQFSVTNDRELPRIEEIKAIVTPLNLKLK